MAADTPVDILLGNAWHPCDYLEPLEIKFMVVLVLGSDTLQPRNKLGGGFDPLSLS